MCRAGQGSGWFDNGGTMLRVRRIIRGTDARCSASVDGWLQTAHGGGVVVGIGICISFHVVSGVAGSDICGAMTRTGDARLAGPLSTPPPTTIYQEPRHPAWTRTKSMRPPPPRMLARLGCAVHRPAALLLRPCTPPTFAARSSHELTVRPQPPWSVLSAGLDAGQTALTAFAYLRDTDRLG